MAFDAMQRTIMVVDDDPNIIALLSKTLSDACMEAIPCLTGQAALETARERRLDAVILDLSLPDIDGLDICRELTQMPDRPGSILILSGRDDPADIVAGLELGADDYITKPFSKRVLLARLRAAMRSRTRFARDDGAGAFRYNGLSIDPRRYEVRRGEDVLPLTPGEFQVLHMLTRKPGHVLSRKTILDNLHGENAVVSPRAVDVLMVGLRKKLGEQGDCVETIRGVGYRASEQPPRIRGAQGGNAQPVGSESVG